jgi:hypothetical protein
VGCDRGSAGQAFDLHPTGMLRSTSRATKRGLLLIDVDFQSSRKAMIESQKYSPFELGLGRLVDMKKPAFVGRAALHAEMKRGVARMIVGLEIDWIAVEKLYEAVGLPPTAPAAASRTHVPIYSGRTQIGARHFDDVVDDPEEDDRAGHDRRAVLRDRHARRNGNDGGSGSPPRHRHHRTDAVLQSGKEDRQHRAVASGFSRISALWLFERR